MPWGQLYELVKPCYYEGARGNKPYDLELMLRIHLIQNLYDLSDEGTRNEIIDSRAFSDFCERDPDAHSVKKGTAWYFGYKAHIGVDKDSGLVHHVEVTSANVHDVEMTPKLMTGDESEIYGDSGYIGAEKRQDAIIRNRQGKKKSGTSRIASKHRLRSCPRADNGKQRRRSIKNHLSGQR